LIRITNSPFALKIFTISLFSVILNLFNTSGAITMSQVFWQAKIWGLLHDPALKALHNNTGRGGNSFWRELAVMKDWVEKNWDPEEKNGKAWQQMHLADYLASASDRGAIGAIDQSLNYNEQGLEIRHLLSAEKLSFQLEPEVHQKLLKPKRGEFLQNLESTLLPKFIQESTDVQQVFWWLWRCLPEAACEALGQDPKILLAPAETRLPDSSIWSHTSITAALAGALAGYDLTTAELTNWPKNQPTSHAYLAAFSFTPVQELIKASRKMRDFWAGSWLLHYLSAKVSWALARKYGPDSLIYPSLFQQPLIDYWLLQQWPKFQNWIKEPSDRQILTAGFPNVIIMVLPKAKVRAAMQFAEETLKQEWLAVGHYSFTELTQHRGWMPSLVEEHKTWKGWLSQQWQSYWSAVAIGKDGVELKSGALEESREADFQAWVKLQNEAYNPLPRSQQNRQRNSNDLFKPAEEKFLKHAAKRRLESQGRRFSVNVGSWWSLVFDATRRGLAGVKNARTWSLPTAFSVRSTVSGLGPAVHRSGVDWIAEGDVKKQWKRHAGLFDGSEQLNANEVVKRVLHKTLPHLLQNKITAQSVSYPDLTAGVAGYLKTVHHTQAARTFENACKEMREQLEMYGLENVVKDVEETRWGMPWADCQSWGKQTHSRYLNLGWLLGDFDEFADQSAEDQAFVQQELQAVLDRHYPGNKPGDWYVLAAGDGDGLSEWLQGTKMKNYRDYIPATLHPQCNVQGEFKDDFDKSLNAFLDQQKRMGPSTHAALSRALLDFSNQLVPYLTEQRYAGRLIYSGGDDVLAYTNLWEWDQWLWDVRQCFKGSQDPHQEFDHQGDYWRWQKEGKRPENVSSRPLFTMGRNASISFGIVIAHHSVPLAIALENLWEAEEKAKKHQYQRSCRIRDQKTCYSKKDAVQVRVLYGNGNILEATSKFDVFAQWQKLVDFPQQYPEIEIDRVSSLFEQAAELWQQHPAPQIEAIVSWSIAFCSRRDVFSNHSELQEKFRDDLANFLNALWITAQHDSEQEEMEKKRDQEIQNWLKLAAFVLRKRDIKI
jgi:CRISPR-associated protein Cmr2